MRRLVRERGIGPGVLVSDAMRACGLPQSEHCLDTSIVHRDGAGHLPDDTLAFSVPTVDAPRSLAAVTGISPLALRPAVSRNAARVIGLDDVTCSIEIGRRADLVPLEASFEVVMTLARGPIVYRRQYQARRANTAAGPAVEGVPDKDLCADSAAGGNR
jgi:N-acetylglucosamine-6-phosphate deacetylase